MATKPITRTPTRSKALAYLREQRVRVVLADTAGGSIQPYRVEAIVRGHQSDYMVELGAGVWYCTCNAAKTDCAHRAAVQMVTGHKSAAAKAGA
jgi:hypothetical protein